MAVDHGGSHRASTRPQAPAGKGATPGPGTLGRASLALAGPGHRALMAAEPDRPDQAPIGARSQSQARQASRDGLVVAGSGSPGPRTRGEQQQLGTPRGVHLARGPRRGGRPDVTGLARHCDAGSQAPQYEWVHVAVSLGDGEVVNSEPSLPSL